MSRLTDLQNELKSVEPKIDFLHEVCGCGQFASITQTPDGFFLAQRFGDVGYNVFLGGPSSNALCRTQSYLQRLSPKNRALAERLLKRFDL